MSVIVVDPAGYAAASAIFGHDLAGGILTAYRTLSRSLASTDAMAGHDAAGRSWGDGYDTAAQVVSEGIAAVQRSCLQLASMLQHTGFNHSLAESDSDSARRIDVLDTTDYTLADELYWLCGDFPMAAGGSDDYPAGWGLVRDVVKFEWPDGQPDRLRDAGTAWDVAGRTLQGLTSVVDDAVASVAEQQAPEVLDAKIVCGAMATHLTSVASACTELGTACRVYAGVIDGVHGQCTEVLNQLIEETDGAEITGLIFSGDTEGGAGEGALAVITSAIARAASLIERNLGDFAIGIAKIVALQNRTGAIAADVVQELQPILSNGAVTAATTVVAGGPYAAAQNAEALAMRRLGVAARINWAGIEAADRMGGHTQREHVGKSDAYLIKRAHDPQHPYDRTSTFATLADAEDAASQIIANSEKRIVNRTDKGSHKIVLHQQLRSPGARIYDRQSRRFIRAAEVTIVIVRGADGYYVLTTYPG